MVVRIEVELVTCVLVNTSCVHWFPRAAVTKYHRQRGLYNRNI